MKDKNSNESRRKILKSIAAGSGAIVAGKNLPESWSRPVVDSVMLPAHAQTSPQQPACSGCFPRASSSFSTRYIPGTFPEGTVEVFSNTTCSGDPFVTNPTVEAADQGEAFTRYEAAYGSGSCGPNGDDLLQITEITCADVWFCDN